MFTILLNPYARSNNIFSPKLFLRATAITLVSYGELSDFNNIKAMTKTAIEEVNSVTCNQDSPIQSFF
jgi:hypothetical protein